MGPIFVYGLLAFLCVAALFRPHVGLIGYFGWVILKPEFLWRWALPVDGGMQKYIVLATLVGWALKGFRGNPIKGPALYACLGLIIYLGLSYVSSFQSHDPVQTQRFMSVIWKIVLMTILAVRLLDSKPKIIAAMWVAVVAQGFNALEINLQYFADGYSWAYLYGWASNDSNTYSIATIGIMGMSAALALYSSRKYLQLFAGAIFVLQLHEIFLLESRGCMLGLLLLGGTMWWYSPKTAWTNVSAVVAIAIAGVLAGPPIVAEFSSIFAEEQERDSSADSRWYLWKAGMQMTADYPMLGLGPWGAETTVPKYYEGGLDRERKALHNLLFEVSTGSGVPATIGYLAFFFIPWVMIRRLWRNMRDDMSSHDKIICLSLIGSVPAYWLSSMFSSGAMLEAGYFSTALGVAYLAMRTASTLEHRVAADNLRPSHFKKGFSKLAD